MTRTKEESVEYLAEQITLCFISMRQSMPWDFKQRIKAMLETEFGFVIKGEEVNRKDE